MTTKAAAVARGQRVLAVAVVLVVVVIALVVRMSGDDDPSRVRAEGGSSTSTTASEAAAPDDSSGTDGGTSSTTATEATEPSAAHGGTGGTTTTTKKGRSSSGTTAPTAPGDTTPDADGTTTTLATTTTSDAPVPSGSTRRTDLESSFVAKHNAARVAAGLPALTVTSCATNVAQAWSRHLTEVHSLSHNPSFQDQLQRGCGALQAWGENVGTSSKVDAQLVFDGWMRSQAHHDNILSPNFTGIGIGVWTAPDGSMWATVNFWSPL